MWPARTVIENLLVSDEIGLFVDQPKSGFENSNDDNNSRRFFLLTKKMHKILVVVYIGHYIDVQKFRDYPLNTGKYFLQCCPWYNMPRTEFCY